MLAKRGEPLEKTKLKRLLISPLVSFHVPLIGGLEGGPYGGLLFPIRRPSPLMAPAFISSVMLSAVADVVTG